MTGMLLLVAAPFLAIAVVGAALLFYRHPVIPYTLALAAPYLKDDPRLAFLNIVNTTMLFVVLTTAIVIVRIVLVENLRIPRIPLVPLLSYLALAAWMFLSLRYTLSPIYGGQKATQFIVAGTFFTFMPIFVIRRIRDFEYLMYGLVVLATGLTIIQFVGGATAADNSRVVALDLGPIAIARITGAMSIVSIVYFATKAEQHWLVRIFWLLLGAVFALSMLVTQTRAAMMLTVAAIGLACLLTIRLAFPYVQFRNRRLISLVALSAIAAVLFILINPGGVIEGAIDRMLNLLGNDNSASVRVTLYHMAVDAWQEHPLKGLGIGGFSMYAKAFDGRYYPHNIILEVGAELGWVGIALFTAILVSRQAIFFRAFRRSTTRDLLQMMIAAEAFFWFAFGNAMVSSDLTSNRMLLVAVGLSIATASIATTTHRQSNAVESATATTERTLPARAAAQTA